MAVNCVWMTLHCKKWQRDHGNKLQYALQRDWLRRVCVTPRHFTSHGPGPRNFSRQNLTAEPHDGSDKLAAFLAARRALANVFKMATHHHWPVLFCRWISCKTWPLVTVSRCYDINSFLRFVLCVMFGTSSDCTRLACGRAEMTWAAPRASWL